MSGKKDQRSEVLRKPDKTVDNYREFLDMDTDEEDFGRQESPEVEEELPLEPEKPVFREDDLIALVKCVKDLTIYSSCDEIKWHESSHNIIEEYFTNPSYTVLCTFPEEDELNAMLNIPTHAFKGFTYFLRSPWQIYTTENFLNTVSFGTINNDVKSNILKFMENLYAPMILHSDDYSSFLKNDMFLNLHEFIIHLMRDFYKSKDLITLYVPKERLLQSFCKSLSKNDYFLLGENQTTIFLEEDERKRKLIGRLEKVVWFWIRQIRDAVAESARGKIESVQDEVNYWNSKYSNLNHLRTQLLNPEVQTIIDILRNLHSPCASKLKELAMKIDTGLKESSSNLMYLSILTESVKNLKVPEEVENSVTEALFVILFIWAESPFYSTKANIEILCQALSSQIIHQCKKYIKLDVALGNNPEMGIQMLEKCIFCSNIYKSIYDNIIMNITSKKWNINEQEIFKKIDTFKQRCCDVIEICKALIIFGRSNKIRLIGGPRGTEYEAYWREIESLFYESLNDIIMASDIIFDVTKSIWLRKINHFRYTILQLENMVINLINDIFENIKNIEEGIEAIYALQSFKKRESLRELLQNKWIQVWKMFSNEIEHCFIKVINQSQKKTDANVNLLCIQQYLRSQYSIIINALNWIGDCDLEKCVSQQYEHVLDVIDKRRKMFNIYNTNGIQ